MPSASCTTDTLVVPPPSRSVPLATPKRDLRPYQPEPSAGILCENTQKGKGTAVQHMLAALVNLDHPGSYVHWHWIQISVANLIVIGVMLVVFVLAIALPIPHGRKK